jgi:ribosomal protein S18 acetylase RimI-like enzyme
MKISRRPATVADSDFARSVHHRAYRDVIERQYGSWSQRAQDKFFSDAWVAAAHETILCDAVPCGYACVENRNHEVYLRELVIDPDFQGRGIGTYLVKETQNHATAREVPVRLQTHIANRALNLYSRLGFRETGRTETHVLMEWNPADPSLINE